jgi:hypothetical protein
LDSKAPLRFKNPIRETNSSTSIHIYLEAFEICVDWEELVCFVNVFCVVYLLVGGTVADGT